MQWLKNSGISEIDDNGEWIKFNASVSQAEGMLGTTFGIYQSSGVRKIRTLHYSVPVALREYIDMIQPTTRFSQLRAPRRVPTKENLLPADADVNGTTCNTFSTPTCIRDLYNFSDFKPS